MTRRHRCCVELQELQPVLNDHILAMILQPISFCVEEYRNQHQPTPLLDFLRHVKDTRLGAPSIGAYGENG